MKFKVAKSVLVEGLQTGQNIVALRTTLPILSHCLITAEAGRLLLTTTNLDITVRCGIEAEVSVPGSTALPARRLLSIVRELPDSSVEIDIDDTNTATINSGASFFKIVGLSEEEFPPISEPDEEHFYKMEQPVFREMLRKCSYAVSADETRYVLNGVLVSFKEGKLTTVATDGRRLALVEQEMEFAEEADTEVILPTKAVNELLHVLGDEGELKIYARKNQVLFQFDQILMVSKLIDGVYPNYRQVIPSMCEERVAIERETLFSALKRIGLLATDKSNAAKLTFAKNKLVLTISTPDIGEAREVIPLKYSGKEITVAFNPEYMMDPLRNLTNDEVYMELTDDLSPGVMKCDVPFLYVLMPMRVS